MRMVAKEERAKDAEEKEKDMAEDETMDADVDEEVVRKRGVIRRRPAAAGEPSVQVKRHN
eukprot:5190324-Heterocapsa_arctica.AAC.1